MTLTIQLRLQIAFEARGYQVDPAARTSKYLVMMPTADYKGALPLTHRYFLGRSGALRFHSQGRITGSVSVEKTKNRLLHHEQSA